jgi:hypothetical protein
VPGPTYRSAHSPDSSRDDAGAAAGLGVGFRLSRDSTARRTARRSASETEGSALFPFSSILATRRRSWDFREGREEGEEEEEEEEVEAALLLLLLAAAIVGVASARGLVIGEDSRWALLVATARFRSIVTPGEGGERGNE